MKTFDQIYGGLLEDDDPELSFLHEEPAKPDEDELYKIEEQEANIPSIPQPEAKPAEVEQNVRSLSDDDIQRIAAAIFAMQKPAEQKGGEE